jgi:hypothetical protein
MKKEPQKKSVKQKGQFANPDQEQTITVGQYSNPTYTVPEEAPELEARRQVKRNR